MKTPNELMTFQQRESLVLSLLRVQAALLNAQNHAASRDSKARDWLVGSLEEAATIATDEAERLREILFPALYPPERCTEDCDGNAAGYSHPVDPYASTHMP